MRYATLLLSLLLTACASKPMMVRNTANITIQAADDLQPSYVMGRAFYNLKTGECNIKLRRYPICLAHEVRHCLEGAWHDKNIPNDEDC